MRKKSGASFSELMNKQWAILSKSEYNDLQGMFKRAVQKNGGITLYDMLSTIESIGLPVSSSRKDKINKEIFDKEIKVLDFSILLNYSSLLKKQFQEVSKGEVPEQNQYLDAFVALGGQPDKSGYVNKAALMEKVKKQFELALDLESIVEGVQVENLDYHIFCSIFDEDKKKEGQLSSIASAKSLKSNDSQKSLEVDELDFNRFLALYDNEEN